MYAFLLLLVVASMGNGTGEMPKPIDKIPFRCIGALQVDEEAYT